MNEALAVRFSDFDLSERCLILELDAVARVFNEGAESGRFNALCWMAVIVSSFPPGFAQEQAEDKLAGFIARLPLTGDQLQRIRAYRSDGLGGQDAEPAHPSLRRWP